MDKSKQPGLQISQIVLLRANFAHREDALSLPPNTKVGEIPVLFEGKFGLEADGRTALIQLRAYTPPDNPTLLYAFDIEIGMLVAAIAGQENLSPAEYASQMGPAAGYPFLREAVAAITMRGRFGPLWLRPMNFLASDRASEEAAQAESTETAPA